MVHFTRFRIKNQKFSETFTVLRTYASLASGSRKLLVFILNPRTCIISTDKVVARAHCMLDRPGQTNYLGINCMLHVTP